MSWLSAGNLSKTSKKSHHNIYQYNSYKALHM